MGPATVSELSDALGLSAHHISSTLHKMRDLGYAMARPANKMVPSRGRNFQYEYWIRPLGRMRLAVAIEDAKRLIAEFGGMAYPRPTGGEK